METFLYDMKVLHELSNLQRPTEHSKIATGSALAQESSQIQQSWQIVSQTTHEIIDGFGYSQPQGHSLSRDKICYPQINVTETGLPLIRSSDSLFTMGRRSQSHPNLRGPAPRSEAAKAEGGDATLSVVEARHFPSWRSAASQRPCGTRPLQSLQRSR